jgi:hypothetical protein
MGESRYQEDFGFLCITPCKTFKTPAKKTFKTPAKKEVLKGFEPAVSSILLAVETAPSGFFPEFFFMLVRSDGLPICFIKTPLKA